MNVLTPIFVVFTAMLIQALLQLSPSVFLIFYHSILGKNSRKKADDLSLAFILGVETFLTIIFVSIFLIVSFAPFSNEFISNILPWILFALLLIESILFFLLYFRKGKCTELFLPRKAAHCLTVAASNVKTRSDAFSIGLSSGIYELVFTLPLIITCAFTISNAESFQCAIAIILYVLSATIPLFITYTFFKSDLNLANIELLRVKNKSFVRLIVPICYLIIAILMLNGAF